MRRLAMTPRQNWREHVERQLGFVFHTINDAPYWDETACYVFTTGEVDELEAASGELEQMALELVDRVARAGDAAYRRLRIPPLAWAAIERSWTTGEKNLYGRFDLRYDGRSPPQLLEYNADTPTAVFEAAVVQWDWLEQLLPGRDQFNSIHEKLIEAWRRFGVDETPIYFTAVKHHLEDGGTVDYLRDTAIQAGLDTARIDIEEIGWDGKCFVDLDGRPIAALFKLYPWEWIIGEPFGHPNLLPTSLDPGDIVGPVVRKPIFGREGANVQVIDGGRVVAESGGDYGAEGFVYQAHAPLPVFDGNYPVIGSWVVASTPAGIGIREDDTPITRDTSRFLPHYFE